MKIIAALLIGIVAGVLFGGQMALRRAQSHDFAIATWWARCSVMSAMAGSILATRLLLGWPWVPREVTTLEQSTTVVLEQIEEIVKVPFWFFFTENKIKTSTKETPVTVFIPRKSVIQVFTMWMLIPMVFIGLISALLDVCLLRTAIRWLG